MRRVHHLTVTALLVVAPPIVAQTAPLDPDVQIRLALQAAPGELREEATVQGYGPDGAFTVLREGSNELICMAPDPKADGFEVSCHHAGLEPFFARGRELLAAGVTGTERTQARWEEFTSGDLVIPFGSINYIVTGDGFDPATGEVRNRYERWVIYTPNATVGTTGITERPAIPGEPWLMFPGTPGSHIMIVPEGGG